MCLWWFLVLVLFIVIFEGVRVSIYNEFAAFLAGLLVVFILFLFNDALDCSTPNA